MTEHHHHHTHGLCAHHHHEVSEKSVKWLIVSFTVNMLLSAVEIIGGVISGSVSLIGDALHNTSDALSILIAVVAFKIGRHRASNKYTYGFKRAEIIGGFVNLILLFISGCYLLVEGIGRLIAPQPIDGYMIIYISVLALIIDAATAKISHRDAGHNSNMKMVFVHNLADAFGSVGVIISGACIIWFGLYRVDGVIALLIAAYMLAQSVLSFPKIVNILMNAAPEHLNPEQIKTAICSLDGVKNVHHIHLWSVSEHEVSLECHIETDTPDIIDNVSQLLATEFDIHHCTIQTETHCHSADCEL